MSNIVLNIVEPASPTPINPVDPGTGTAVPDTGLFTSGIGGAEAAIIATITLAVILAIVGAIIYRKKKAGEQSNTASLLTKCKQAVKNKKYALGLAVLALLVSIGTVAGLLKLGVNAIDSEEADNTEIQDSNALTVTAESEELTIELADEPVFAVLPVDITVTEATEAGYTLTAYAEDTNLVSTTDPSNVIPMVTLPEPLEPNEEGVGRGYSPVTKLTDNTYGLSLVEPESEADELYTTLSTDSSNPTIVKSMPEYSPTAENDTTTIYYGFYITPDVPYGTYTGSDIYYDATINTTLVTFNGNDLYFNNDTSQTTNEVEYIAVPQEESEGTINQIISGEYLTPSQALPYIFLGWSEESTATTPTYTSAEDLSQNLPILPNTPITLYAVWQHATELSFDGNGSDGGEAIDTRTIAAGDTITLPANTFTREGYHFTGWNTVATPTEQEPGESYADQADYTADSGQSKNVTLYAQWEEDVLYMQDVAIWGSTLQQGDEITVVDKRDGKGYTVARLADDNIWMTQNLDFNIVNGGADLNSTNTDVPADWADAGNLTNTYATDDTTWNYSATTPESYDPGNLYWNGNVTISAAGTLDNRTVSDPSATSGGTHYHVGNYYNWTAAVAMNDSSSYVTDQQDMNQSICPAGWRLPTYSGDKSYDSLVSAQGLTSGTRGNIQRAPTYFVYGGAWNSSSRSVGYSGSYRSSVVGTSNFAYSLYFGAFGSPSPQASSDCGGGLSLRCVAR